MSVLKTVGLVKQYGGRRVVDQVNLELHKGEIVGLLGPNGAGKTTTFNMVVGITRPNAGQILLDEVNITRLPMHLRARRGVGYLAQEKSVFRKLTVEENIRAIAEILPISHAERRRRIEMVIEELGVGHLVRQRAYTLSGGERRRVEIARALVCEPTFILLDEPFSGVDPKAVEELQNVIYQMQRRGLGILITDHSVRETLTVTDRAYLIYEGKVLISGTAKDLVNDPTARQYYLGERFYMDTEPDVRKASFFGSLFGRREKSHEPAHRPPASPPPAGPAKPERAGTPRAPATQPAGPPPAAPKKPPTIHEMETLEEAPGPPPFPEDLGDTPAARWPEPVEVPGDEANPRPPKTKTPRSPSDWRRRKNQADLFEGEE